MECGINEKTRGINFGTQEWTAGFASMICGAVTHLFGLVTIMHNNDDIGQQPYGYGTGITSGRWLLTILGDMVGDYGGNYNLHFVNGILFLALIAISAGFVVSIFHVTSRRSAALIGMLFSVFPAVSATMAFRYTTVYYGVGLLLAIVAAWVLERYRYGLLFSTVAIAFSLGIYQAYIPFTIAIFVLLLIQKALKNNADFWSLVRKGLYYCAALILGLILYFLCLKQSLALYGTELSDYNGVNNMGKLSISEIPGLIKEAVYIFCMLPFKNFYGLVNLRWIQIMYLILGAITVFLVGYILLIRVKKLENRLLILLLCALLPIAVNFIVIMCPDGYIYTLMLYPFVLVGCIPIVVLECAPAVDGVMKKCTSILEKVVAVCLAVIVFGYAYDTNINYTSLYFANRQTENYLNSMVVQVRMTEGFDTEKEWAFIGNIEDPLLVNPWQYEARYGGNEPAYVLINRETRYSWFQTYFGYSIPFADNEKVAELGISEEVKQMPCWPNDGSIKVIGDVIVIKCQDLY